MNPVVLIAMYGRKRLVQTNLELLHKQKCKVVVITYSDSDYLFVREMDMDNVHICTAPNEPLGRKWQIGVDYCKNLGADPLITLGSDDFLSSGFVEQAVNYKELDFIFFTQWHIHDSLTGKDYFLKYKNMFPLGSGRVFFKRFLERNNWTLFDKDRSRLLDDYAWDSIKYHDRLMINPPGMKLLSVKGNWETMNTLEGILEASEKIEWWLDMSIDHHFGYDRPIKDIFK